MHSIANPRNNRRSYPHSYFSFKEAFPHVGMGRVFVLACAGGECRQPCRRPSGWKPNTRSWGDASPFLRTVRCATHSSAPGLPDALINRSVLPFSFFVGLRPTRFRGTVSGNYDDLQTSYVRSVRVWSCGGFRQSPRSTLCMRGRTASFGLRPIMDFCEKVEIRNQSACNSGCLLE